MRHVPLRLWALVVLSALLQLLPFPLAGPVPSWRRLVSWVCLLPLLWALNGHDRRQRPLSISSSAALGYLCGFLWFFGNCYWIYQTMFHYGGLPSAAAAGILVLFSLYLGLYFALFGAVFALLRKQLGGQGALVLSPVLWVAVELARTQITGFPWDLLGYAQIDNSTLTQLAPYGGVMCLSFLVALGNALWIWRPAPSLRFLGPVLSVCLLGTAFLPGRSQPSPETATAVLLQDNLSVGADAGGVHESQGDLLASFTQLTRQPPFPSTGSYAALASPRPDLIAWPEAPTDFSDADPSLRQALSAFARTEGTPLVVDAVGVGSVANTSGKFDEFVSASFFLPDGTYAGRYDKMHLVPFGEYTPYKQLFFFAGHLLDGLNFVPGTQRRLFSVNGHRFGVFICYESIFGAEVREFASQGATVLVNLSDDGWYGDTSAPWEHLDMARMRAVENRRWLLRATNTGLTASIDPEGHIVAALPRHLRSAITVPFAYRSDLTFYTRHGDWVGWLCALVLTAVLGGGLLGRRFGATRQAQPVH